MPLGEFMKISPGHELHESDIFLRTATGETFTPHAYASVNIQYEDFADVKKLYLVDQPNFPTLFGRQWLREMNIDLNKLFRRDVYKLASNAPSEDYKLQAKNLLQKYKSLTKEGIGCIPNTEARLELTQEAPDPVYLRARPVAHALIEKTDAELDYLEKHNVIQRIDVSEWSHPIVIVSHAKGRKVRICGDFKVGINRFLNVDDYPLKNVRHALDNIGNGRRFTKLDISSAFLHMPVREQDRKYLVVNTHRGLYQFSRLSNGLANASAVWQRFIESI